MPPLSPNKIAELLEISTNGSTAAERGKALEDLICYIFGEIPGFTITMRNMLNTFHSEEIDVAFWNDRHARGTPFLPSVVLVESKNWSNPVDSAAVSWFDSKLRSRGLGFGILVAANGITGVPAERSNAHQVIAGALREQRQLIVITRADLESVRHTNRLVELIKQKLCELAVTGTAIP
jgi:hypothetical protein